MNNTRVSIIAAIDEKRGLGKNNDLLFRIPEDHKRVREVTREHPLVMGRKTFESLGRLLPNRTHIVITRDPNSLKHLSYQPHVIVSSIEEGIEIAKKDEQKRLSLRASAKPGTRQYLAEQSQSNGRDRHALSGLAMTEHGEIFIFGGGQIFTEAIEKGLVDRLYLTLVKGDYGADTFFPEYSQFIKVLKREEHASDGFVYTFLDLEK